MCGCVHMIYDDKQEVSDGDGTYVCRRSSRVVSPRSSKSLSAMIIEAPAANIFRIGSAQLSSRMSTGPTRYLSLTPCMVMS